MGNSNKQLQTYITIAGLIALVLGFMFFSKVKNGLDKGQNSTYKGRTIFKTWDARKQADLGNVSGDDGSDYKPSVSYADSTSQDIVDGGMVNSVNFIDKKKKAAAAKGKKVGTTTTAKTSSSNRRNGLSNSDRMSNNNDSNQNFAAMNSPASAAKKKSTSQAAKEQEEDINNVKYWEDPIFVEQSPAAVSKLISSYQIQKVSSTVFYELVGEMTTDERVNIRSFGVQALVATPSTRSFSELAVFKSNETDTELRTTAETEVTGYSAVNRMNFVISNLNPLNSSNSQTVSLEAMRVVVQATKNYSEVQQSQGNSPRDTASAVGLETKLTQAYNTLEVVAQTGNDVTKAEAVKTMDSISKVITI